MAIGFVGSPTSTALSSNVASVTVNKPAGASSTSGHVLYAQVFEDGAASGTTITLPANWVLIKRTQYNNGALWTCYRVMAAAEDSASSFTWSGMTSGKHTGAIDTIAEAAASNPLDVAATFSENQSSSATPTAPSITPATAGCLVLNCFAVGSSPVGHPSGNTERFDVPTTTGTARASEMSYFVHPTATATGTKQGSATSAQYCSQTIAFRPSASAAGPSEGLGMLRAA